MAKKAAAKKSTGKKRGRPPQTAEQKAAKAAAATPPAKAVAKAKKPKAEKKASAPSSFNSPASTDEQRLFLSHLPIISAQIDRCATANSDLRNLYKKAKADGFDKYDFEIARQLATAEKAAKQRAKLVRTLTIAKYCGNALGGQLDLFLEPDRTPATENAYEEGRIASMKNEAAKPGYDPSTAQHREYMRGYHEVQAEQVTKGIKPVDNTPKGSQPIQAKPQGVPKPAPAPEKLSQDPAPQAAPEAQKEAPYSPMRMTRADYLREQELARQAQEKTRLEAAQREREKAETGQAHMNGATPAFATTSVQEAVEEDDEGSMFKRRVPAGVA